MDRRTQMYGEWVKSAVECTNDAAVAAQLCSGFSDPTRLAIILEPTAAERRVTEIVEALTGTSGNISGRLPCLAERGLVADRPSGQDVFCRLAHPEVIGVLRSAEALVGVIGEGIDVWPNYDTGS